MAYINKELYDALIAAKVSDELATQAASTSSEIKREAVAILGRLSVVEKLQWIVLVGVIASAIKM